MKKLLIILILFTSCRSVKTNKSHSEKIVDSAVISNSEVKNDASADTSHKEAEKKTEEKTLDLDNGFGIIFSNEEADYNKPLVIVNGNDTTKIFSPTKPKSFNQRNNEKQKEKKQEEKSTEDHSVKNENSSRIDANEIKYKEKQTVDTKGKTSTGTSFGGAALVVGGIVVLIALIILLLWFFGKPKKNKDGKLPTGIQEDGKE